MIKLKNYLAYSLGVLLILIVAFSILILKIYNYSKVDETQKAEAIVVLGASQWNGEPSPILKARLNHALYLYQNNYASKIILTGGIGKGEIISESQVGKKYLIEKGLEEKVIFTEKQGHTTWQTLKAVKEILRNQNLDSVILVTNGFHMKRVKKMCRDLDIRAFASPLISKDKISEFKYVLRETVVYVLYLLFKI